MRRQLHTFLLALCFGFFTSSLQAQRELPTSTSEYTCGTTSETSLKVSEGKEKDLRTVNMTILDGSTLIQAVGKMEAGRLLSVGGVLSNLESLRAAKYKNWSSDRLLNDSDSPLKSLSQQQRDFLSSRLKMAQEEQARQSKVPGRSAIYRVELVELRDSYGKPIWTVLTKRTKVDKNGDLQIVPKATTYTIFSTDRSSGLMTATSYLFVPDPDKEDSDGFEYFRSERSSQDSKSESDEFEKPKTPELPKISTRKGDAVLPRIGENIGKDGTMTFEMQFERSGTISSVQYRIGNRPNQIETKTKQGPMFDLLKNYSQQFEKLAGCCVNDSPSHCVVKYRPGQTSDRSLIEKLPLKSSHGSSTQK